jgi:hypothetical protein
LRLAGRLPPTCRATASKQRTEQSPGGKSTATDLRADGVEATGQFSENWIDELPHHLQRVLRRNVVLKRDIAEPLIVVASITAE